MTDGRPWRCPACPHDAAQHIQAVEGCLCFYLPPRKTPETGAETHPTSY